MHQSIFVTRTKIYDGERTTLNMMISKLFKHKKSGPFREPVDCIKLGILDYPSIVTYPMDLATVQTKLKEYRYNTVENCLEDIHAIWENCKKYNPADHWIVKAANELEQYQRKLTRNYLKIVKYHSKKKSTGRGVKIQRGILFSEGDNDSNPQGTQPQQNIHRQQNIQQIKQMHQVQRINEDYSLTYIKISQRNNQSIQSIKTYNADDESQQFESIRQNFLKSLELCSDSQSSLIFMLIKRRCSSSIFFDQYGNASINLQQIDNYTIRLAQKQINNWKAETYFLQ